MALSFFTDLPSISDNNMWLIPSKSVKFNNAPVICVKQIVSIKYYVDKNSTTGTYINIQTTSSDEKWYYETSEAMMNDYFIVISLLCNVKSTLSFE